MSFQTFLILCFSFAALLTGYFFAICATPYKRYRWGKKLKCLVGKHEPGPVRDQVGGRRVQRCDWCDKVVHEYEVTLSQAKGETIRRI